MDDLYVARAIFRRAIHAADEARRLLPDNPDAVLELLNELIVDLDIGELLCRKASNGDPLFWLAELGPVAEA